MKSVTFMAWAARVVTVLITAFLIATVAGAPYVNLPVVQSKLPFVATIIVTIIAIPVTLSPSWTWKVLNAPVWEVTVRLRERDISLREARISQIEEIESKQRDAISNSRLQKFLDFQFKENFRWEGLAQQLLPKYIYFYLEADNRFLFDVSFVDPEKLACRLKMGNDIVAERIELTTEPGDADAPPPVTPGEPHIPILFKGLLNFKVVVTDALAEEVKRMATLREQAIWSLEPYWRVTVNDKTLEYRCTTLTTNLPKYSP